MQKTPSSIEEEKKSRYHWRMGKIDLDSQAYEGHEIDRKMYLIWLQVFSFILKGSYCKLKPLRVLLNLL